MTEESLKDKVVVITGAARGLGREYARQFGAAGCKVVAADLSDCDSTVAEVKDGGAQAVACTVDVGDGASTEAMAAAAVDAFGGIDVLVNNAALYGTLQGGRFDSIDESQWDDCMRVNVKGIWNCCKAVVGAMRGRGGGSIINITSLAALYGMPYSLHYSTSKGAVIGMTRALARELGRDWIRVNAVAPSMVMTEGTDEFFADKKDKAAEVIRTSQSLQRNLEAPDLAGTVLYLASDASRYVTGQTLMVDGGTHFL